MNTWSMRERLAVAIAKARGCDPIQGLPAGVMAEVDAVIGELREPTPAMLAAFYRTPRGRASTPVDHWQAMLDEAGQSGSAA